ncbi:hypothetical protein GCM10007171_38590 [Dickeya fangzhongdai]|nr:hypothetical protein GCM10007171_38590 [Dickeya fangzhongdai]
MRFGFTYLSPKYSGCGQTATGKPQRQKQVTGVSEGRRRVRNLKHGRDTPAAPTYKGHVER